MKEKILIKSYDISNPNYGKYPGSRSINELINNGFLLLDKPQGPTSHDVVAQIKKILGVNKACHIGTLDPGVSGVLPILLGEARKVMPAFQKLNKEYVGVMHLHKDVDDKKIKKIISEFTGKILQTPPVKSAVARKEREREIFSFEILDRKERDICFSVKCESGTYIRKLIDDIGKEIGGSHLRELRRIKVGIFGEENCHTIDELKKIQGTDDIREIVFPIEFAIPIKKIWIKDSAIYNICNGAPLITIGISRLDDGIKKEEMVAIMSMKGELVALGVAKLSSKEMLKGKHIAAKTDRVLMKKETYPKF